MALTESQLGALQRVKEHTENTYDQNILYIASGTLVLSLTFIEKIVNVQESNWVNVLICSWAFLVLTIIVNLVSHQLSAIYHTSIMYMYGEIVEPEESEADYEIKKDEFDKLMSIANTKTDTYSRRIVNINWLTTGCLIAGLGLLVTFCSLNIKTMKPNKEVTYAKGSGTKGASIVKPIKTTGGNK